MRISPSLTGKTPFESFLGHNMSILQAWDLLERVFFNQTHLESEILEQVRRALTFENDCLYCQLKAGRPIMDISNQRMVSAIDFAQKFARQPKSIGDDDFVRLSQHFSETEIAELCPFICFISACQHLGRIYQLQ